jgi:hypothetical protein
VMILCVSDGSSSADVMVEGTIPCSMSLAPVVDPVFPTTWTRGPEPNGVSWA